MVKVENNGKLAQFSDKRVFFGADLAPLVGAGRRGGVPIGLNHVKK